MYPVTPFLLLPESSPSPKTLYLKFCVLSKFRSTTDLNDFTFKCPHGFGDLCQIRILVGIDGVCWVHYYAPPVLQFLLGWLDAVGSMVAQLQFVAVVIIQVYGFF